MRKKPSYSNFQTRSERRPHRWYGEVGGTIESLGSAGEALRGAQGGSGALKRETRSFGCSDGGQDQHAEDST